MSPQSTEKHICSVKLGFISNAEVTKPHEAQRFKVKHGYGNDTLLRGRKVARDPASLQECAFMMVRAQVTCPVTPLALLSF